MNIFDGLTETEPSESTNQFILSKTKRKQFTKSKKSHPESASGRKIIYRLPTRHSFAPLSSKSNEQLDPIDDDPLFLLKKIPRNGSQVPYAIGVGPTYPTIKPRETMTMGNGNVYKYQKILPHSVPDTDFSTNFAIGFAFVFYSVLLFCFFKYKMSIVKKF